MKVELNQVLAAFFIVVLFAAVYLMTDLVGRVPQDLIKLGLVGVFFISMFGTASIFIPTIPIDALVVVFTKVYPVWLVSLIAGIGSGIGETSGYFVGRAGHKIIDKKHLKETRRHLYKHGNMFIFLVAMIPVIPYDIVGLVSGYVEYPFFSFIIATALGKSVRYFLVASGVNRLLHINGY